MKKNMPKIAAARHSMMPYVPARLRSANMCRGVIGCRDRLSTMTNTVRTTTAAANEASVSQSRQPSSAARMNP